MKKAEFKARIWEESKLVFFYFLYIFSVLTAFTIYRKLILSEFSINYIHYSYNFVEALVLAKVILIGQLLHIGERFSNKSLLYPTIYKTIVFGIFVFIFSIVERFFVNFIKGNSYKVAYDEIVNIGFDEIIARTVILLFSFLFFFAFLEIGRILGGKNLFNLFLRRKHFKTDQIST